MAHINFHLAPPPKMVDGLLAVPIDIRRIRAALVFDGAAQSASGDATLEFRLGPNGGSPIFDLRQTISAARFTGAAWLDGAPFPIDQLAQHNFGGGTDAELRVLAANLRRYPTPVAYRIYDNRTLTKIEILRNN